MIVVRVREVYRKKVHFPPIFFCPFFSGCYWAFSRVLPVRLGIVLPLLLFSAGESAHPPVRGVVVGPRSSVRGIFLLRLRLLPPPCLGMVTADIKVEPVSDFLLRSASRRRRRYASFSLLLPFVLLHPPRRYLSTQTDSNNQHLEQNQPTSNKTRSPHLLNPLSRMTDMNHINTINHFFTSGLKPVLFEQCLLQFDI